MEIVYAVLQFLVEHLNSVILALLAWVSAQALVWFKDREILQRFTQEIVAAVLELDQTYVDGLKAARADGKVTPEEAKELRDKVIAVAKANIGKKGLARLVRILGIEGLAKYATTKVEATIAAKKVVPPPLPSPSR